MKNRGEPTLQSISTREAAKILKCAPRTVRRLFDRQEIKGALLTPRALMLDLKSVEKCAKERRG